MNHSDHVIATLNYSLILLSKLRKINLESQSMTPYIQKRLLESFMVFYSEFFHFASFLYLMEAMIYLFL